MLYHNRKEVDSGIFLVLDRYGRQYIKSVNERTCAIELTRDLEAVRIFLTQDDAESWANLAADSEGGLWQVISLSESKIARSFQGGER